MNRLFKILNGGNNMSTYMPKAGDITRTWYILDAEGQSLGRVAAKAAHILRGKHKPTYAPHADCGDHVIIINCSATAVLPAPSGTSSDIYTVFPLSDIASFMRSGIS